MNAFTPYAAQLRWTFRSSNLITNLNPDFQLEGMKQLISFYLELESSSSWTMERNPSGTNVYLNPLTIPRIPKFLVCKIMYGCGIRLIE